MVFYVNTEVLITALVITQERSPPSAEAWALCLLKTNQRNKADSFRHQTNDLSMEKIFRQIMDKVKE